MTTRNTILTRIANLRNTSGRTEQETLAALNKAQKLMMSYRVDEAELAMAEATGEIKLEIVEIKSSQKVNNGSQRHKVQMTMAAISKFTDTKMVIYRDQSVAITGDRPDVEMAYFLIDLIKTSLDHEYSEFRKSTPAVGRGAKASFQTAMACRLNERLNQDPIPPTKSTGTDLIVADIRERKQKEVNSLFRRNNPRLRTIQMNATVNNGNAFDAGRRAADKVSFGRPMPQSQNAAQLT